MRKFHLLPVFLLLTFVLTVGPAQASSLPPVTRLPLASEEAEELEGEGEEAELDESEDCGGGGEEGEDCEEAEEEAEAEECVIEDATASVAANPGSSTVRLTIRYRAFAPASVAIDARLRGAKGGLHLGASRARFRRAGVFHDSFGLSKKEMVKALAAREFAIDLRAVNTPAACALHLTTHRGAARKLLWS